MKKLIINGKDCGAYSTSGSNSCDPTADVIWFDMGDYEIVIDHRRVNTLCWGDGDDPTEILID